MTDLLGTTTRNPAAPRYVDGATIASLLRARGVLLGAINALRAERAERASGCSCGRFDEGSDGVGRGAAPMGEVLASVIERVSQLLGETATEELASFGISSEVAASASDGGSVRASAMVLNGWLEGVLAGVQMAAGRNAGEAHSAPRPDGGATATGLYL
ncbi:MAG: hypothetical protein M0010_03860 [Actinomycetota bacterium]|nr:hypothetical protein [Actinomycetota bacterium]